MIFTFDIGGTQTRFGLSSRPGTLDAFDIFQTKLTPQSLLGHARSFLKKHHVTKLEGIAGGVAGILKDGVLLKSPNLPKWEGFAFDRYFEIEFGEVPFSIKNDAELAGIGEAHYGAGIGVSIVAYLTISTGVGGARIVDGIPDPSSFGFEPGHSIFVINKQVYEFEELVSGKGIEKRYGIHPEKLSDQKSWEEILTSVAFGLTNTILYWSPDVVIVGGGLIKSPFFDFEKIQRKVKKNIKILSNLPPVVPQKLGDKAALLGASTILTNFS